MAGLSMKTACFITVLSLLCSFTAFGQEYIPIDDYSEYYYDYVTVSPAEDIDYSLDDWLYELLNFTDPCSSNPCENGGSCIMDASGGFTCQCTDPYTGKTCQKVKDVCKNAKCGNGECLFMSTPPFYQCLCTPPFKPPDCKKAAPCRNNPCLNGGTCQKGPKRSSFQCSCPEGYSGKLCDVGPNDCYQDDGGSYRGMVRETAEGQECLFWTSFFIVQHGQDPFTVYEGYDGIGPHNYCRNPDGDDKPWCFIKKNGKLDWKHCDVRKCSATPPTAPPPPVTPGRHFAECGKPQPGRTSRIYRGKKAVPGAHPWQVSLQYRQIGSSGPYQHLCGGILLESCWVLTAAHCIMTGMEMQAVMGGVNIEKKEEHHQVIPVERVIPHERYKNIDNVLYNDVALLELKVTDSPYCAKETRFVKTACLPSQPFDAGAQCAVSGWGKTETQASTTNLQEAHVRLISLDKCKQPHVYADVLDDSMLCAGYMSGGIDSCEGDSGGPLVCERNGKHDVVGVVSWGAGCGLKYKPGVYANVANFIDWISNYVRAS